MPREPLSRMEFSILNDSLPEAYATQRKPWRLTLWSALLGLAITVAFAIFSGITPLGDSPLIVALGLLSLVLCPGSILFVTFIDAEPWTNGFWFMWIVIAVINVGLYGLIGHGVGRLLWRLK